MIRSLAAALLALLIAATAAPAQNEFPSPQAGKIVQGVVSMCLNAQGQAVPTNQAGACPGGSSGSGTGTIGAAVPSTGVYSSFNVSGLLRGWSGLSTGALFAGAVAIVDGSGNQITTFGGAATSSNASSGVATSSTNQAAVVWNYGFNGTTWDQMQVDANKYLKVAPQAAELHIGEIGQNIIAITNAMTTTAVTYATGQAVGGLQTLTGAARVSAALGNPGTGGLLQIVLLTFKDAIGVVPFDVFFFNANPSGSTCTNAAAFVLADADRDKVITVAQVTNFIPGNAAAIGQANNLAAPYSLASATSIFACVVSRGSAAITGVANASLKVQSLRN